MPSSQETQAVCSSFDRLPASQEAQSAVCESGATFPGSQNEQLSAISSDVFPGAQLVAVWVRFSGEIACLQRTDFLVLVDVWPDITPRLAPGADALAARAVGPGLTARAKYSARKIDVVPGGTGPALSCFSQCQNSVSKVVSPIGSELPSGARYAGCSTSLRR